MYELDHDTRNGALKVFPLMSSSIKGCSSRCQEHIPEKPLALFRCCRIICRETLPCRKSGVRWNLFDVLFLKSSLWIVKLSCITYMAVFTGLFFLDTGNTGSTFFTNDDGFDQEICCCDSTTAAVAGFLAIILSVKVSSRSLCLQSRRRFSSCLAKTFFSRVNSFSNSFVAATVTLVPSAVAGSLLELDTCFSR